MRARSHWLFLPFLVCGCANTPPSPQAPAVTRTAIKDITDETLARDYAAERSIQLQDIGPPKLGLALSGGGTKAAMFAHGVLHGLHDAGVLQKVDVISSVSGGGYAAYWYFTKLLASKADGGTHFAISSIFNDCMPLYWVQKPGENANGTDRGLWLAVNRAIDPSSVKDRDPTLPQMPKCPNPRHFEASGNDPFRWQAHLARWPDVFATTPTMPNGDRQGRPDKEIRAGIFKAFFVEPVTQLFKHQSSVPLTYQWGIERAWGLNPEPRRDEAANFQYTNVLLNSHPMRVDPDKMNWKALRDLYIDPARNAYSHSIPLWIINTNSGGKTGNAKEDVSRTFELTPFGSGSEKFGYVNAGEPLIQDLGTSMRASAGFADAQGLPRSSRNIVELVSRFIPGLRWGVPVQTVNTSGETIKLRLSDGGGAENMGLYSLLKRGIKDIIVVDASEDVEGDMEDLCVVKNALGPDIEMHFPTLQNFDQVCEGRLAYNVSDWKSPVIRGTVTWKRNGAAVRESRIWLLKAAWNQELVRKTFNDGKCDERGWAGCFLTIFYGHNTEFRVDGFKGSSEYMMFPQISTMGATLNASSYFMWGYRELGRSIARQLVWDSVEKRLDTLSTECVQPVGEKIGKDRPRIAASPKAKQACLSVH
jgi:hypothetical protein